ncbi:MAG TPA: universal stress protein [Solirubrobacterales bacterium]|jgi:APA family basic amino acid/polyamine antiporter|nr:universal stress protein [Solirubrobacterales bacterium]
MAQLKVRGLRKTVGVPGLFATAYGNVGSSIYYALGLVAAHALGLTPLVFMFAGGLFALTAKTYAEGAAMFPEAGGSSSFARHAFNEVVSFIAGWGLSLDYILTIAISAFFVPHYLGAFFPALGHSPGDVFGGAAVIALLALVNIRGLGESAKLNIGLAILDLVTQLALVVLGVATVLHPTVLVDQIHLGVAPSYSQLIFAVSISMLAYTGIETVSNMAEEARDPGEEVPKAVNLVLIAVLGIYAGISIVALSALPVTQNAAGHYSTQLGTVYADDPVLGIVSALGLHGMLATVANYYVGALAATILLIATNAGLIGISRLSWSLAEHRQLPGVFAKLHPRYHTPWFTILFFSAIAVLLVLPGNTDFLGNLYSFGAMLSFTIAHLSVIALRLRDPNRERPYRAPWNVSWRGREVPLTAVLGALGTGAAFVSVIVLHAEARIIGTAWLGAGLGGYLLYRRRLGLDPRELQQVRRPERPLDFLEVSYKSVVVPIFGTSVDADAMHRAAAVVDPDATVQALYVLKVPPEHALPDTDFDALEYEARCVLDIARLQARSRGLKVRTKLVRTRNPGRAIVEEAIERRADLIYVSTEHAPSDERLLGPTTRYLLAKRPCRVIVEGGQAEGSGTPAGNTLGRWREPALPSA